jgi:hypothetical protein
MTPELLISRMKERVEARYRLATVGGRPEELVRLVPGSSAPAPGVSFAYAGQTVRVRPMVGRKWQDDLVTDFAIEGGWAPKLDDLLDPHFGYRPPPTPSTVFPAVGR